MLVLLLLGLPSSPVVATAGPRLQSISQLRLHGIQRQTLDYSCGAAALTILLEHYLGEPVSEEHVLADIVLRLSEAEMHERILQGFSMLDLKGPPSTWATKPPACCCHQRRHTSWTFR